MVLLTRFVAVLTVALSAALMAVSAYATASDGSRSADRAGTVEAPAAPASTEGAAAAGPGLLAAAVAAATAPPQTEAAAGPTPAPRYPVPDGGEAVPAVSAGDVRDDLSPAAAGRVWRVLSLRPGEFDPAAIAALEIPPEQFAVMQRASESTGIPWQIFGAIAKVESDLGRNMSTSSAGAIGYGQFLPEMWAVYGDGGDPYDFHHVIPAMGRFLLDAGASGDIPAALHAYNHSWPYVAQVLSYAAAYGYRHVGAGGPQPLHDQLAWPVAGPISSFFGPAHPLGIDIDQTMAPTAFVRAAHDGVVIFAGGDPCCSYGYYAILMSPSGLITLYGHFSVLGVASGQAVRQGEPLGIVGSTGFSTGTHLHFEVIDGGLRQDPLAYLP